MKILIEGAEERYTKYMPNSEYTKKFELVYCNRGCDNEEKLKLGGDADVLFVDAISIVDADLINRMPKLKMIHSEGVAFNGIDIDAARKRSVYVCNNKGCNARAVAEQAIMLMLELLRKGIEGDIAVREGRQMKIKEQCMITGITELGSCKVGLIGFGDIAKATAQRLHAFDCEVYYNSPHRKDENIEKQYYVNYLPMDSLLRICDIISIHATVTPETIGMVNKTFISKMKQNAYIINTARGDIVNNMALRNAIISGKIAGAGLDTISPEPMLPDNPLIDMPKEVRSKIVLAPHLGGITEGSFSRAHRNMWNSALMLLSGGCPNNVVNGL